MSKISSRQLEAFRAVMITGSMTGAAELLHMTQPAVSRLVKDFEGAAGLQFFERHANHLTPTRDAMIVAEEVERSFIGLNKIEELVRAVRLQNAGSLKIGAMPAFAIELLPLYAASFVRGRPLLHLTLNSFTSPEVFERVASGELDFGYVMTASDRPGFYIRKLGAVAVIAMRHDHPLAAKSEIQASDLVGETLIGSYRNLFQARIDLAIASVDRLKRVDTTFAHIACVLASEGVGVTFMDPYSVSAFSNRGLVVRNFKPAIECDFALVVAQKRLPTPLAESFISGFKTFLDKRNIHTVKQGEEMRVRSCSD